jgi:hypothetical protein
MPLRDHFVKDPTRRFAWEGFHSQWTTNIVRHLNRHIVPEHYHAESRVRLGTLAEIDIGTRDEFDDRPASPPSGLQGAMASYSPPAPVLTLETDLSQDDLFEVQVVNDELAQLVAAIELISSSNKDRPQSRHDFVVKCASLLKAHVSLVLIDIVTNRQANLFHELTQYLEIRAHKNPFPQVSLYACSLLPRGVNGHARVDVWPAQLKIGAQLPSLPLWLRDDIAVALELELTYEESCRDLRA